MSDQNSKVNSIPTGYHSITPYLIVKDGVKALEYYKRVFDGKDKGCMMASDGKSVAHAEIEIGNSVIMLSDEYPGMNCLSPRTIGGSPVGLYIYVDKVDETFNRAVAEGAKVLEPVKDQFWGDRVGNIEDPFGHRWSIATRVKDITSEEIKKAAEKAFATIPK